jgi:hypothetical protein
MTADQLSLEEVEAILDLPLMPWQRAIVEHRLGDEAPMRGLYLALPAHDALDRVRQDFAARHELDRLELQRVKLAAARESRSWLGLTLLLAAAVAVLAIALIGSI